MVELPWRVSSREFFCEDSFFPGHSLLFLAFKFMKQECWGVDTEPLRWSGDVVESLRPSRK